MYVQLEVLKTAEIPIPRAYVFRGADGPLARLGSALLTRGGATRCPCLAYVIRHPSAGTLLVDTGMHPDAAANVGKDFGRAMGLLFRSLEPAPEPFDRQLRGLGVDPGGVERVVMTHLHADHTSGMRLLPNATFLCTPREWAAATRSFASTVGYVGHHLPPAERMQLIDLEANGEPHGPFARTIDLFEDGSVRLLATPGHTPGHMSVLVRVAGGRHVLIVGDAAYTLRSIREQILPLFTADDGRYRRTLRELRAFSEQEPDATLVPSHDPSAWRQLAGYGGRSPTAPAAAG